MNITQIKPEIRYVGVNDRKTTLFEGLWPLPQGVSYNAYLLVGDKIALIDTVDEGFTARLARNIQSEIGDRPIDYLIINHMEPDHSGSIAALRLRYPNMQLVSNAKALAMVEGYYGIKENTLEVKEGDTLDLGRDIVLSFHMAPMVHWPETMVTWYANGKTLFSGDAFGCFGALDGAVCDTQLPLSHYRDEMVRYYAAIVGKYGAPVQRALQKVKGLQPEIICATHGPVWQQQVGEVIDIYDRLSRYEAEEGAVVAYSSMHGNTEELTELIARYLVEEGVSPVCVHNLSTTDPSVVLRDIFRYSTLVVGAPTYNGAIFTPTAQLLDMVAARAIPQRNFAFYGSYTWAGAAVKGMQAFAEKMKWTPVAQPLEMKQAVNDSVCEEARRFAREIAENIRK